MTHPITSAILDDNKTALRKHMPAGASTETCRTVSRELLWHAMFQVASMDPTVDMQRVAAEMQDAIRKGTMLGHALNGASGR